ncbi:Rid family hydrolase [Shimia sediminis]|uniref:Rid family hydrolase n=1 Tax=Shimia sediminis TaxID=2497945 RepID=UPI000F8CA894|nr:Rid family hydrolase [Shimia sediminis]
MRDVVSPDSLRDAVDATGFSPAVRAGDFLFLTGATGGAPDGTMPDSVSEQCHNALAKVVEVLKAADLDANAVVDLTSYHTDIETDFAAVDAVLRAVLSEPLPAWTAVEVARLRRPGARIEFRIVAHAPNTTTKP